MALGPKYLSEQNQRDKRQQPQQGRRSNFLEYSMHEHPPAHRQCGGEYVLASNSYRDAQQAQVFKRGTRGWIAPSLAPHAGELNP